MRIVVANKVGMGVEDCMPVLCAYVPVSQLATA